MCMHTVLQAALGSCSGHGMGRRQKAVGARTVIKGGGAVLLAYVTSRLCQSGKDSGASGGGGQALSSEGGGSVEAIAGGQLATQCPCCDINTELPCLLRTPPYIAPVRIYQIFSCSSTRTAVGLTERAQ